VKPGRKPHSPFAKSAHRGLRGYLFPFPGVPTGMTPSVADVTVRREKALDFSGCNSRPGTGSLHPTIEAAAEATRLSELSV
jgi:hypothetical protein